MSSDEWSPKNINFVIKWNVFLHLLLPGYHWMLYHERAISINRQGQFLKPSIKHLIVVVNLSLTIYVDIYKLKKWTQVFKQSRYTKEKEDKKILDMTESLIWHNAIINDLIFLSKSNQYQMCLSMHNRYMHIYFSEYVVIISFYGSLEYCKGATIIAILPGLWAQQNFDYYHTL